jgi:hypothetical protein
MTSKNSDSHSTVSSSGALIHAMDRRYFLRSVAEASATVGLRGSAFGQALNSVRSSVPPGANPAPSDARLPDGTEHISWEKPLTFLKTYYVDNSSTRADDDGPGTESQPFRTINKAAQVLQPGERVVIASGTYRECVRPARGGIGPSQMISYEAAPQAKVFIKGSEILKEGWHKETIPMGRPGPGGQSATPDHGLAARADGSDVSGCLQSICA